MKRGNALSGGASRTTPNGFAVRGVAGYGGDLMYGSLDEHNDPHDGYFRGDHYCRVRVGRKGTSAGQVESRVTVYDARLHDFQVCCLYMRRASKRLHLTIRRQEKDKRHGASARGHGLLGSARIG